MDALLLERASVHEPEKMITEEAANSGKEIPSTLGESPGIYAHYTWTAEELLAAQRLNGLHTCRRPFRYVAGAIFVLMFITGWVGMYHAGPSVPSFVMILIPIYVAFFRGHYQRWAGKRQFHQRPDKDARVDCVFNSEGIKVVSSTGSKFEMPWSSITKAVISPQGVLLYPLAQMFYWFPRHAFESDETFREFTSLVRKNVTKTHEVRS